MIYLLFGSAVRKLLTLNDYVPGDQVDSPGEQGAQTGSYQNYIFDLSRQNLCANTLGPNSAPTASSAPNTPPPETVLKQWSKITTVASVSV
jgi:hypothetical protein